MSTVINHNYSQFYAGTESLKSYGSGSALKRDTLVRYAFNTTDEHGSKIMDKMSKEEMFQTMKDIRSQYSDDVIVQFSGDALASLAGNKYSGQGADLDKIMNREQRDIPEDMITQLEGTHQKVSENGKIDTRLDWHENLREKAPGVCDEFDDLMQRIFDHALNHRDDGETFAKEFIEMVKKAEKAIAAYDAKETAASETKQYSSVTEYAEVLSKKYECVRNGSVSISESFLRQCADDPEKAKELEENLSLFKDIYQHGYESAKRNAAQYGGKVTNYSLTWNVDSEGNISMMSSTTVVTDNGTKSLKELNEERMEKWKAKKEETVKQEKRRARKKEQKEQRAEQLERRKKEKEARTYEVKAAGTDIWGFAEKTEEAISRTAASGSAALDIKV